MTNITITANINGVWATVNIDAGTLNWMPHDVRDTIVPDALPSRVEQIYIHTDNGTLYQPI